MPAVPRVSLDDVRAAQERIRDLVLRTPLIPLQHEDAPAQVYLKLENLQSIGSFKVRGAANALRSADPEALRDGVFTASAGNMAQGVGYVARQLGVPFQVVAPDHAPRTKVDAIRRLGGEVILVPFDEWWQVLQTRQHPAARGHFVHPVSDAPVIAGNGTIGLEILEDLPDVDAVVVPYGGGGLSSGIATVLHALRPEVPVYAAEVETACPLAQSFEAGAPVEVEYTPSFVDGIGGKSVLAEMWPLVSDLLAGSLVVSLREVADAIRLLVERHRVIAEGAGAASLAAALSEAAGAGKVVCVVSGGNLDSETLAAILRGEVP